MPYPAIWSRARHPAFHLAEPAEGFQACALAELGLMDSPAENSEALIIGLLVYRIGDAIFAPVGEAIAGRVAVAGSDPVDELGKQAQGT